MPTLLSLHVQDWTPGTFDAALTAGGRVLKTMSPSLDPVAQIVAVHPHTALVVRKFEEPNRQVEYLLDGEHGGMRWAHEACDQFAAIIAFAHDNEIPIYVEAPNETPWTPGYDHWRQVTNRFTLGFVAACRQRNVLPLVLNIAVGNPPGSIDEIRYIMDGLAPCLRATKAAGGAIGYHGYGNPTVLHDAMYYALRYRLIRSVMAADLQDIGWLLTECGIDRGINGGTTSAADAGWKSTGITGEEYARQLEAFDNELLADPYVLGATIFTAGSTGMWGDFAVDDCEPVISMIARRRQTVPPPPPPPVEPPPSGPGYDHIRVTAQNVANILTQLNVIWALGNAEVKAAAVAIKDHINESPVYG